MRFAWLKKKYGQVGSSEKALPRYFALITIIYNAVWWLPVILPLTKTISYRAGTASFLVTTIVRAIANSIRNNVLAPEQAQRFPLRAP